MGTEKTATESTHCPFLFFISQMELCKFNKLVESYMKSIFQFILFSVLELSFKHSIMEIKRSNLSILICIYVALIHQIEGKISTSC